MRTFGPDEVILVASPKLIAAHGEPRTLDDVARMPTLSMASADERSTWRFLDANGAPAELTHAPADQLAYLMTEQGKPFKAAGFGNWFRDRCDEAGLKHCAAHGLRKAAAVRHALNGATAPELMAWFGWKTIGEAQRYIEEANRIKLAESAGAKMGTRVGSPRPGEPTRIVEAIEIT